MKTLQHTAYTLLCLITFLVSFYACKNDHSDEPTPAQEEKPGQIPGMGDMAGPPKGIAFELPQGIRLTGPIKGEDDLADPGICFLDGTGHSVTVSLPLENTTTSPITITFPAGLILISTTDRYQHGILLEELKVMVAPRSGNGGESRCKATLMLSCLNLSKDPADSDAEFVLGPVTSSVLIKDFITRLSSKKILYSAYADKTKFYEIEYYVQDALWSITDGDGLTDWDLEKINSIPSK